MDYTTLSLTEVGRGLGEVARQAQATFGALDVRQLNWRSDPASWSVAQCVDHLLTSNRLMLAAAEDALSGAQPRTVWQRLPILPGLFGRMLIRSQSPGARRKYTASPKAQPSTDDFPPDVVLRFVEQHRDAVARLARFDAERVARTIMTSPFIGVITYSVLDGCRLVLAHDRRHLEQARRVTEAPGFPGAAAR